jgi:hypothetical protein
VVQTPLKQNGEFAHQNVRVRTAEGASLHGRRCELAWYEVRVHTAEGASWHTRCEFAQKGVTTKAAAARASRTKGPLEHKRALSGQERLWEVPPQRHRLVFNRVTKHAGDAAELCPADAGDLAAVLGAPEEHPEGGVAVRGRPTPASRLVLLPVPHLGEELRKHAAG